MLDWLKTILGTSYTEDIDNRVSAKLAELFVTKKDYDSLSAANAKLTADAKTDKEAHQAEITHIRTDYAVESALTASGARNNIAVKALLSDFLKSAKLDASGKSVEGLTDAISKLASDEATSFLFKTQSPSGQFSGLTPGNAGGMQPASGNDPSKMSYDELCSLLASNPNAVL